MQVIVQPQIIFYNSRIQPSYYCQFKRGVAQTTRRLEKALNKMLVPREPTRSDRAALIHSFPNESFAQCREDLKRTRRDYSLINRRCSLLSSTDTTLKIDHWKEIINLPTIIETMTR